jgi:protein-S-isoprenylcysteine O-methyltransferase Ste14
VERASGRLKAKALLGLANLVVVMAVLVFVPAGTWRYWEGWVFLLLFSSCALAISLYLVRRDPGLLERRVAAGPIAEQRTRQKVIQTMASTAFLSIIVVPALDRRFGWSHVPLPLVVVGDALVVLGFLIVFRVFRENSFASAVIEVGAEQRVIDTGPYARVRHPMYAGALVLLAGIPLALGSFWGLLALLPFTGIIVWRLRDEERFLERELPGYQGYRGRVRHRLVPGVW